MLLSSVTTNGPYFILLQLCILALGSIRLIKVKLAEQKWNYDQCRVKFSSLTFASRSNALQLATSSSRPNSTRLVTTYPTHMYNPTRGNFWAETLAPAGGYNEATPIMTRRAFGRIICLSASLLLLLRMQLQYCYCLNAIRLAWERLIWISLEVARSEFKVIR